MIRHFAEMYQYRALLWSLTVRELKARYRASILGFLWTFLNPTLSMLVYALVFGVLMQQSQPRFPFFVFAGLLPWIYFSTSVTAGVSSVSDRRDLLTKVRFPAQVLPATVVLSNLINYVLSLPLLIALGLMYGDAPTVHILLFVPLLFLQTLFTLALTYILSALNVTFRDLQHIVANILQMVFFLTPIVWRINQAPQKLQHVISLVNPLAALTTSYRDIFFEHKLPEFLPLLFLFVISIVLLYVATMLFEARREEFAELV